MSVLLTTEGTYPFSQGGVSTWCDTLVKGLPMVDFTVLAILTDPFVTQKFSLPSGATLIRLPLWGTDEPSEHLDNRFSSTYLAKQRTTAAWLHNKFLPVFDEFIREILAERKDSEKMGAVLVRLYEFFREFDYKVAFKSPLTWERYKLLVSEEVGRPGSRLDPPDVYGLIQSLGWLYRFFNVVNTRVPETTLSHASAAAFCGIPCVIAKLVYGVPFLLTEHGVYMREQYLSLSKRGYSSFLNSFLIRMIWTVTDLNYHFADQISPVCEYNTRWERCLANRHERIKVIYNGVDNRIFTGLEPRDRARPTVVTVARIDPIKDLLTLIRAAGQVRRAIPDVRFLVYGSVSVPAYFEDCLKLIRELALENTVELMGHTTDMAAAYDAGDIVAQSSISEAFPYAVIEAMFAGKPVVSTAVGGVAEAIGDTGFLVTPGDAPGLAGAIVKLLQDKEERLELGQEARRRALDLFTLDRTLITHMKTYIRLAVTETRRGLARKDTAAQRWAAITAPMEPMGRQLPAPRRAVPTRRASPRLRRQLDAERAVAFLDIGYPEAAARYLSLSVRSGSAVSPADVAKTALLASVYERLGMVEESARTRAKLAAVSRAASAGRQRILAERAYALADAAEYPHAIRHMQGAIDAHANSPATPVLMLDMSRWLERQGQSDLARECQVKAILIGRLLAMKS